MLNRGVTFIKFEYKKPPKIIIIFNYDKDTLRMVGYLNWLVVVLSVFQIETDKLVKYEVIQRWPAIMCTQGFEHPFIQSPLLN